MILRRLGQHLLILPGVLGLSAVLALSVQHDARSSTERNLRNSDFARSFSHEGAGGYIQVTASRIFLVNSSTSTILAYDLNGQLIGSLRFPEPSSATNRVARWYVSPQRNLFLLDENRLYLSWKGRILSWDVQRGETAEVMEFDRPVRLLKDLGERLILEDPDSEGLFTVVDGEGAVLFRIGKPLVTARNPQNDEANRFFAFFRNGKIEVLFQHYPIYRVYDVGGELLREGRYETPAGRDLNPPLEVLAERDDEIGSWIPHILQARASGRRLDRLHVYFNGFRFGVLDESFKLVFERFLLTDPACAASPRVIDIDAENGRLLLFKAQNGQPQFDFLPIRPKP